MKVYETICSVKYHETYCEAGHEVTYIPISLWSEYWWKYKILTSKDVATYTDLLFFCKQSMSFTLEWLAKQYECNIATLQQIFDNLGCAELLTVLKTDPQGEPNRLILQTVQLSLEKDYLRLKRQVEEITLNNSASFTESRKNLYFTKLNYQ